MSASDYLAKAAMGIGSDDRASQEINKENEDLLQAGRSMSIQQARMAPEIKYPKAEEFVSDVDGGRDNATRASDALMSYALNRLRGVPQNEATASAAKSFMHRAKPSQMLEIDGGIYDKKAGKWVIPRSAPERIPTGTDRYMKVGDQIFDMYSKAYVEHEETMDPADRFLKVEEGVVFDKLKKRYIFPDGTTKKIDSVEDVEKVKVATLETNKVLTNDASEAESGAQKAANNGKLPTKVGYMEKKELNKRYNTLLGNKDIRKDSLEEAVTRDENGEVIKIDMGKVKYDSVEKVREEKRKEDLKNDSVVMEADANTSKYMDMYDNPALDSISGDMEGADEDEAPISHYLGRIGSTISAATRTGVDWQSQETLRRDIAKLGMDQAIEKAKILKPVSDTDMRGLLAVTDFNLAKGPDAVRKAISGKFFLDSAMAQQKDPNFAERKGYEVLTNSFDATTGTFKVDIDGKEYRVNPSTLKDLLAKKKKDAEAGEKKSAEEIKQTAMNNFYANYGM